jgi:hypothetical protein
MKAAVDIRPDGDEPNGHVPQEWEVYYKYVVRTKMSEAKTTTPGSSGRKRKTALNQNTQQLARLTGGNEGSSSSSTAVAATEQTDQVKAVRSLGEAMERSSRYLAVSSIIRAADNAQDAREKLALLNELIPPQDKL